MARHTYTCSLVESTHSNTEVQLVDIITQYITVVIATKARCVPVRRVRRRTEIHGSRLELCTQNACAYVGIVILLCRHRCSCSGRALGPCHMTTLVQPRDSSSRKKKVFYGSLVQPQALQLPRRAESQNLILRNWDCGILLTTTVHEPSAPCTKSTGQPPRSCF